MQIGKAPGDPKRQEKQVQNPHTSGFNPRQTFTSNLLQLVSAISSQRSIDQQLQPLEQLVPVKTG